MLILPQEAKIQAHNDARKGLESHFNSEMEKILNANSSKDKYWILGKVRFPQEHGGQVGRTFLQASDEKPPVVKNAFLIEVDNRRGIKTTLWVSNPDGSLRLPTLGKTVRIAPNQGKKGVII